jgi:hemerythrin-like domain-containing protein
MSTGAEGLEGGAGMGGEAGVTRRFVLQRVALTGGLAAMGLGGALARAGQEASGVSPAEDLMREHGVLRRLLLVYEAGMRRMRQGGQAPMGVLHRAATIIRDFIEQYHEKLEEQYVFPLFKGSQGLGPLTQVLLAQHKAGRAVTARILQQTAATGASALGADMRAFVRMYRPHAAREDTVLFPALHAALSEDAYADMGERFEDKEHELFGASGFEGVVKDVAALEQALGIYALDQFTPGVQPEEAPAAPGGQPI